MHAEASESRACRKRKTVQRDARGPGGSANTHCEVSARWLGPVLDAGRGHVRLHDYPRRAPSRAGLLVGTRTRLPAARPGRARHLELGEVVEGVRIHAPAVNCPQCARLLDLTRADKRRSQIKKAASNIKAASSSGKDLLRNGENLRADSRARFRFNSDRPCLRSRGNGRSHLGIGDDGELGGDHVTKANSEGLFETTTGDRHKRPDRSARRSEGLDFGKDAKRSFADKIALGSHHCDRAQCRSGWYDGRQESVIDNLKARCCPIELNLAGSLQVGAEDLDGSALVAVRSNGIGIGREPHIEAEENSAAGIETGASSPIGGLAVEDPVCTLSQRAHGGIAVREIEAMENRVLTFRGNLEDSAVAVRTTRFGHTIEVAVTPQSQPC